MIRRPPRSTLFSLHDALPISVVRFGPRGQRRALAQRARHGHGRSEEHTSELQSRRDLVCRLLLEKKTTKPATQPAPPANNGIPEKGGGEGDSDNNGGPEDGDGVFFFFNNTGATGVSAFSPNAALPI